VTVPEGAPSASDLLDLFDWRRTVADLYAEVRRIAARDPEAGWHRWRGARDRLFREHPQSPIPASRRSTFDGVGYFPYDPAYRVLGATEPTERDHIDVAGSDGGSYGFTRFATVAFELLGEPRTFGCYWLDGYAGGLFVSFRDATSGRGTYGAGRYLLDTAKGADLGAGPDGRLVLDFNFSYNPSCSYDPRWACPLAPPENRLGVPVEAGERLGPRAPSGPSGGPGTSPGPPVPPT
jgi:uncharacterized protein (DUF1684 family)